MDLDPFLDVDLDRNLDLYASKKILSKRDLEIQDLDHLFILDLNCGSRSEKRSVAKYAVSSTSYFVSLLTTLPSTYRDPPNPKMAFLFGFVAPGSLEACASYKLRIPRGLPGATTPKRKAIFGFSQGI